MRTFKNTGRDNSWAKRICLAKNAKNSFWGVTNAEAVPYLNTKSRSISHSLCAGYDGVTITSLMKGMGR